MFEDIQIISYEKFHFSVDAFNYVIFHPYFRPGPCEMDNGSVGQRWIYCSLWSES